jgi:hypothetical protein
MAGLALRVATGAHIDTVTALKIHATPRLPTGMGADSSAGHRQSTEKATSVSPFIGREERTSSVSSCITIQSD